MKKSNVKPRVYAIVGPTGVGKTSLSIALAKKIGGEIISADSRQVYKHLNVGTEKISKRDMRGIAHHLLDVCDPKNVYTVANFKSDAETVIRGILLRGKKPILVGGTGWYIDALVHGHTLPEVPPNHALRKRLEKMPAAKLYMLLEKLDAARAKSIDRYNARRLIRAIEIAKALGKVPKVIAKPAYSVEWIGVLPPTEYEKQLRARLLRQIKMGLLSEIRNLRKLKLSKKRINELGLEYRTGLRYLDGGITREEMVDTMVKELTQLAKRQMTWFKRNKHIVWKSYTDHMRDVREIH